MTEAPYALSPSTIGTYFLLDCERYLRWRTPTTAEEKALLPKAKKYSNSPLIKALTDGGHRWEGELIDTHLKDKLLFLNAETLSPEKRLSYAETLELIRSLKPGEWLYQATLTATPSFYQRFGLDANFVTFRDCYPDLITMTPGGKLRIVDAKASEYVKITHKIQVGLYAVLLQEVLKTEGIDIEVDTDKGGIWLGGQPEPTVFDLNALMPHIEHLIKKEIPRILAQEREEAPWHVHFKCEWCQWFDHCKNEAVETQSISLIPYLSPDNKKFLSGEIVQAQNLSELQERLQDPDEADAVMAHSASLKSKAQRLKKQSEALIEQKLVAHQGRSLALPRYEDITVLIAAEREPSTKAVYAISMLVSLRKKHAHLKDILQIPDFEPLIFVAEKPKDCLSVQQEFIRYFHSFLKRLDAYNQTQDWREQLSLQSYTYENYEQTNLTDMLLNALSSPLKKEALELLFYFRHLDNIQQDQHQDPEVKNPTNLVSFPLVSILGATRELLALPIPLSWQLAEVLKALPNESNYTYESAHFAHFPLSNYLDSDLIHYAWQGHEKALLKVKSAMEMRARGLQSALNALRYHPEVSPALFAWPPKFKLPAVSPYQDPIHSRLAFMTLNENIVRALETRKSRTLPQRERELNLAAIRLTSLGNYRFKVETLTNTLKPDTYDSYLLWPDTPEGEQAQAEYDDLGWYNKFWVRPDVHRTVCAMPDVKTDPVTGEALEITLKPKSYDPKEGMPEFNHGEPPPAGTTWHMGSRFCNFNTSKIFKALSKLEENQNTLFSDLLQNASQGSQALPLPHNIQESLRTELQNWSFTISQSQAFEAVMRQNLTLVWGPPGTGKTHFLSFAIAGLVQAHLKAGKPFRVLISAFTHAAMDNVLKKLVARLDDLGLHIPVFKVNARNDIQGVTCVPKKAFFNTFKSNEIVIMAGTTWNFEKLASRKTTPQVDLMVIDEASQMTVPEASQLWQVLSPQSRMLVVGDHYQLAPIIADDYPEPEATEPLLTRSIFEAFQHSEELALDHDPSARKIVYPLLECWRMNNTLTTFSSEELYTMTLKVEHEGLSRTYNYHCATDEVARQIMPYAPQAPLSPLAEYILDPDYPMVLCVIEDHRSLQENIQEAQLVAELSRDLRQSLLIKGQVLPPGEENDALFWSKGLFVVSPHHVQIMAIKRALNQVYDWQSPPFVDTVDKMQGQEAQVVLVSYGVSDVETAIQEAEFIYDLNRLNVAITRAKTKSIVCIPRPLLEGSTAVLESEIATRGLAYMQQLEQWVSLSGQQEVFDLPSGDATYVSVYRR